MDAGNMGTHGNSVQPTHKDCNPSQNGKQNIMSIQNIPYYSEVLRHMKITVHVKSATNKSRKYRT
jgi:hypothetical protein